MAVFIRYKNTGMSLSISLTNSLNISLTISLTIPEIILLISTDYSN